MLELFDKAALFRGHGSFAVVQMLEGAFQWTSSPEASRETLYLYPQRSPGEKKEGEEEW